MKRREKAIAVGDTVTTSAHPGLFVVQHIDQTGKATLGQTVRPGLGMGVRVPVTQLHRVEKAKG